MMTTTNTAALVLSTAAASDASRWSVWTIVAGSPRCDVRDCSRESAEGEARDLAADGITAILHPATAPRFWVDNLAKSWGLI